MEPVEGGVPMAKQPIILSDEIIPPPALVRVGLESLPTIVRAQGERFGRPFIKFFTASIRNTHGITDYEHSRPSSAKPIYEVTSPRILPAPVPSR